MNDKGFTLIEIMIVLVIVSTLAAMAIPAYTNSVSKSRRTDAKIAVEKAAVMEEQHFFMKSTYSSSVDDIGGSGGVLNSPEDYYVLSATGTASAFTVTATAINGGTQWDDTGCRAFSITNTGVKSAIDSSSTDSTAACW